MTKTILLTGATDGIGLATAKSLVSLGHHVLIHGRNKEKLGRVKQELSSLSSGAVVESYVADLSIMSEVESLAEAVSREHESLDVLINNAGVFVTPNPVTSDGMDVRFLVNTIAPYLLTKRLLPLMNSSGRVINLSSAAQMPVDMNAFKGSRRLADGEAYAQSKLAITMWSHALATTLGSDGPAIIAVNPGSFLGSKMVKEAYGSDGKDIRIGADILTRMSLDDEFSSSSGKYFDNDSGQFASPHPDARNASKSSDIVRAIEVFLAQSSSE